MSNKKPANIEVLAVEVKGDNFSKAKVRCLDSGEESWHPFYRKVYKTGEPTAEERLVVPGARLKVAYQFKMGKAKGDGTNYPDEWVITDTEALATQADAREAFAKTSEPRGGVTDRDKIINAQSARKDAAVIEAALIVSMGHEKWWEERGVNAFKELTQDLYDIAFEVAKGDPFA